MPPRIETVSVAQFAKDWGVTPRRVQQWIQEGMPHRMRGNGAATIVRHEANAWLLEREEKKGRVEEDRAKIRRLRAEADLKEAEARERLADLVPREEWAAFIERVVGGFNAVAMGELQPFEREIVRVSTAAEARALTQKMQARLMNGARQLADSLDAEASELARAVTTGSTRP